MTQTGSRIKAWILFLFMLAISRAGWAQDIVLHGIVKDSATQTPLTNASIAIKGLRGGARSNGEGRFRIPTTQHAIDVSVSNVGYVTRTLHLDAVPDGD